MRSSKWGFAIVEMAHLLGLAALGGSILLVDLRLLGITLKRQPVRILARELSPLLFGSLGLMFVSGVLLIGAEPMKCYYHPAFRLKMLLLFLALGFYFTLHKRLVKDAGNTAPGWWTKTGAILSLLLWLAVGLAGRAIGFF
jgi:hypothetical protein